jgi:lysylphosphatidylglycerol synthetase-like protein (DUF2156 family)
MQYTSRKYYITEDVCSISKNKIYDSTILKYMYIFIHNPRKKSKYLKHLSQNLHSICLLISLVKFSVKYMNTRLSLQKPTFMTNYYYTIQCNTNSLFVNYDAFTSNKLTFGFVSDKDTHHCQF